MEFYEWLDLREQYNILSINLKNNLPSRRTENFCLIRRSILAALTPPHQSWMNYETGKTFLHCALECFKWFSPASPPLYGHFPVVSFTLSFAHKQVNVQSSGKARPEHSLNLVTGTCILQNFIPYFNKRADIQDHFWTVFNCSLNFSKFCLRGRILNICPATFPTDLQHIRALFSIKDLNSSVF